MNIGIFGGSFNPPHMGHLVVAESAREQLALDRVFFVPAAVSPHKLGAEIPDASHRLAMLSLALEGNRRFEVCDLELRRGGVSFTIDTLEELSRSRPADRFHLLIGADNLSEFHTWRDPEGILDAADVTVLSRPGYPPAPVDEKLRRRVRTCQVPAIGIESRVLRRKVREGKSIRYLVPPAVEEYIHSHRLYLA